MHIYIYIPFEMPLDILLLDRISIFPTIRLNFRLSFSRNSERLKHAGSVRNRIATGSNSRHLFQCDTVRGEICMQREKACTGSGIDSRLIIHGIEKRNCANFKNRERERKGRRINYTFFFIERQSPRYEFPFYRRLYRSRRND